MRTLNYAVLALLCLINVAIMLFGLGMDGMRHGRPSAGTFDSYYLECCVPALFSFVLLTTAFIRFSRAMTTVFFTVALLAVGGLFVYIIRDLGTEDSVGFSAIVSALFAIPIFSWKALQRSRCALD